MTDSSPGNPAQWPNQPPAGPYRPCPYCAQPVLADAAQCPWCGSQLSQLAPSPPSARRFAVAAGLALGGVLVGVSPVVPWIKVVLLGDASMFDAASLPGNSLPFVLLPVALVVCGCAALISAFVLREGTAARATAFVLFAVAGVVGGLVLTRLLFAVSGSSGYVRVGVGPWFCLAGAVVLLAGAVVPPPRPASPPAPSAARTVFSSVACGIVLVLAALGLTAAVGVDRSSLATAESPATSPSPSSTSAPEPVLPAPETSTGPASSEPATSTGPAASEPQTTQAPAPATNDLAGAEAAVEAKGYRPYPGTAWERTGGLQVILGTVAESGDGYANRAFFFLDGRYLGTDTSADSAGIQQLWSTDDTVALSYEVYNAPDPMCCPTADAATVRYHWTGSRLVPLDAIPPADPAANHSRR
ncbi:LppP/LprE family lipoprotein [Amycolatopsis benzoatilytica]|uniref:LppP/LprE family lipoprotein n=1 Tax=Amycolatopsis benzoatilytica TaxID=346045 RepID=UPI0012B69EA3|nr:LppP/LprE family lipoprotein [Amycolatopsis benzoatilytica]